MTIDDRARRAVQDIHNAVEGFGSPGHGFANPVTFHANRVRRRRNQRIAAGLVAAVITIVTLVVLTNAFRPRAERQPATPSHQDGLIVFRRSAPGVEAGRFYIIEPDGSNEVALPWSVTSECPMWFPDGSRILIQGSAYPGAPLRPATIRPDGTGLMLLDGTKDPNLNLGCGDISPDGTRLVLEGFSVNGGDHSVAGTYTVRASDGGGLVRLNDGGGEPSYLPDGRVLFGRENRAPLRSGIGAIFVSNADGSDMRRLIPWESFSGGGGDGPANSSPDGEWIVFPQPQGTLGLVHPDGTAFHTIPIDLPQGSIAGWPHWSPDGTRLVFQLKIEGNGQTDLYLVRPDGTDLVQITNTPYLDETDPDWSPAF